MKPNFLISNLNLAKKTKIRQYVKLRESLWYCTLQDLQKLKLFCFLKLSLWFSLIIVNWSCFVGTMTYFTRLLNNYRSKIELKVKVISCLGQFKQAKP